MRIIDDDEVRVLKEGMSVEESRIGAYRNLSACLVRRAVCRREFLLAPRKVADVDALLVSGLEHRLADELSGWAEINGSIAQLYAPPIRN